MTNTYAKVIVKGSPISKSNFKLFNLNGRAILPYNSGKYHDRYALYEEEIAYEARSQNPGIVFTESLIAILKVYYKSKKRHPDSNNITKSIFDGIEKSGLIINDAQIRRIIIDEFYDTENPRFELELFCESNYDLEYNIVPRETKLEPVEYSPPPNKKSSVNVCKTPKKSTSTSTSVYCEVCGKAVKKQDCISTNKGKGVICKKCLSSLF